MGVVVNSVYVSPNPVKVGELFVVKVGVIFNPLTFNDIEGKEFDTLDGARWEDIDHDI